MSRMVYIGMRAAQTEAALMGRPFLGAGDGAVAYTVLLSFSQSSCQTTPLFGDGDGVAPEQ